VGNREWGTLDDGIDGGQDRRVYLGFRTAPKDGIARRSLKAVPRSNTRSRWLVPTITSVSRANVWDWLDVSSSMNPVVRQREVCHRRELFRKVKPSSIRGQSHSTNLVGSSSLE